MLDSAISTPDPPRNLHRAQRTPNLYNTIRGSFPGLSLRHIPRKKSTVRSGHPTATGASGVASSLPPPSSSSSGPAARPSTGVGEVATRRSAGERLRRSPPDAASRSSPPPRKPPPPHPPPAAPPADLRPSPPTSSSTQASRPSTREIQPRHGYRSWGRREQLEVSRPPESPVRAAYPGLGAGGLQIRQRRPGLGSV